MSWFCIHQNKKLKVTALSYCCKYYDSMVVATIARLLFWFRWIWFNAVRIQIQSNFCVWNADDFCLWSFGKYYFVWNVNSFVLCLFLYFKPTGWEIGELVDRRIKRFKLFTFFFWFIDGIQGKSWTCNRRNIIKKN